MQNRLNYRYTPNFEVHVTGKILGKDREMILDARDDYIERGNPLIKYSSYGESLEEQMKYSLSAKEKTSEELMRELRQKPQEVQEEIKQKIEEKPEETKEEEGEEK